MLFPTIVRTEAMPAPMIVPATPRYDSRTVELTAASALATTCVTLMPGGFSSRSSAGSFGAAESSRAVGLMEGGLFEVTVLPA
ncbi:hypothetical protein D3C74_387240 [compost metagenome]